MTGRAPSSRGALALVALAVAAPAAAHSDWTEPLEPFQVGEGLYYVGTAGLAAYLLTSSAGHALVDAPLDENVERVLANIRALGFDPADVRVQLASHAPWTARSGTWRR